MRKLTAMEWMTLDGVIQAPGTEDEDPSGGFRHGGWHMPYMDEVAQQQVVDDITAASAYLLGRRTYEVLAAYWPHAPAEEQVVAEPLNSRPKHVASTTLTEPLAWQGATVLQGDVAEAVALLKQDESNRGDLHLIGSSRLLHTLLAHDLVDELRLMIDPLAVGGGKRLFPDDGVLRSFRLVDHQVTSTGAFMARYELAARRGQPES
jgi:dihydrofolate reductase